MMKFHALADIFPLMEGVEFDELVTSIKENGQQHAIVTIDDAILDGRNRYRACLAGEIEPRFERFIGADPIKFVIDINVRRRHLNESQRAMIAAKLANLQAGQRADYANRTTAVEISTAAVTLERAADLMNVNRATVSHAKKVIAEGTFEEVKAVQEGKAAVSTIARQIRAEVSNIQRKRLREQDLSQSGRNPERIQKLQINAQVWAQLSEAITNLSMLPLPADVSEIVRMQAKRTLLVDAKLAQSLKWLKEFSDVWSNCNEAAA